MTEKTHPSVGGGEKAEPLFKKSWSEVANFVYNADTDGIPASWFDSQWPADFGAKVLDNSSLGSDKATDIIYHSNFDLGSAKARDIMAESAYGMAADQTGVKGVSKQVTEKKDFAFRTETPDHAYWHRMYNTPAAFETVYQDYTTSIQKKGTTPSKSAPNTADPDPQPGALWSVSMVPDGTQVGGFAPPGTDPRGVSFDGTYLWVSDPTAVYIYQLDKNGNPTGNGFAPPGTTPKGLAWDGEYLWVADDLARYVYQLDATGSEVSGFGSGGVALSALTWDGVYLWLSGHYNADYIYQYKPDGTQVGGFAAPSGGVQGLVWDGKYFWSSDSNINYSYQLARDGTTKGGGFALPASGSQGLGWDGRYLWHCDGTATYTYQLGNTGNFDVNYRIFAK